MWSESVRQYGQMNEDDFSCFAWANAAKDFCSSSLKKGHPNFTAAEFEIAPPLNTADLTQLQKKLPEGLPVCVMEFVSSASAACRFRYVWDLSGISSDQLEAAKLPANRIYGGSGLCVAASLREWIDDCKAWATDTWIADDSEQQEIWLKSFPIAAIENGDYLALRTYESANPPVVYLSHDGESKVIAPSFTNFLKTWERLCYLGPEIWMLENFIDPETGFLNADTDEAAALRALFKVGT